MYRLLEMTAAEYHANATGPIRLSRSIAHKLVSKSPFHAFRHHPRLGGETIESNGDMVRGTVIHAIIGGENPFENVAVLDVPDYRTAKAKKMKADAIAAGKTPMKVAEYEECMSAAEALKAAVTAQIAASGIGLDGQREGVIYWNDNGVDCQCRLDLFSVADGVAVITDFKSCESAHPSSIERGLTDFGLDMQAAIYPRAVGMMFPDLIGRIRYRIVFVEKSPPHLVTICEPSPQMQSMGISKWFRALKRWRTCMATGEWPAYTKAGEIVRLYPPQWQLNQEIELNPSLGSELENINE